MQGTKISDVEMIEKKKRLIRWGTLFIVVVCLLLVINIFNSKFLTPENIANVFAIIPTTGILAMGMTFVIITGGIDLSVGYNVTFGVIIIGLVYPVTENPYLAIIAAIIVCTLVGAANGLIITKLKIVPFIATLGTMSIIQGIYNVIIIEPRVFLTNDVFDTLGYGKIGFLTVALLIMIIMYAIGMYILNRTKLGIYTYAIGSSEKNSRMTGINVDKYKFLVYVLCGVCVGISACLSASRTGLATPSIGGNPLTISAIAAVVIGGTDVAGGVGGLLGTVVGVLLLEFISNALILFNVPAEAQDFIRGTIIIFALLFNYLGRKEKRSRNCLFGTRLLNIKK